jgi:hypothetical protein
MMLEHVGDSSRRRQALCLVGAALAVAFAAGSARAATLTVNTAADEAASASLAADEADGAGLSLREAVYWANGMVETTIAFDAGLAGLTIVLTGTGDGTYGPSALAVSSTITIDGVDAPGLTISGNTGDANRNMRLFLVKASGVLTLRDVAVANGRVKGGDGAAGTQSGGAGGGAAGVGGAILSLGDLTLTRCTVAGNAAIGGKGGRGAVTLYAVDGERSKTYGLPRLYTVDKTTGAATLVGPIGHEIRSIVWDHTTNRLFGFNLTNTLEINPATGAGTIIGPHLLPSSGISGCTGAGCTPAGQLYVWKEGPDALAAINKATGAGIIFPSFGFTGGSTLGIDRSGTCYVSSYESFFLLNLATGGRTALGSFSPAYTLKGMCFDETNVMYAAAKGVNRLVTVNPATREVTTVGSFSVPRINAMTFVLRPKLAVRGGSGGGGLSTAGAIAGAGGGAAGGSPSPGSGGAGANPAGAPGTNGGLGGGGGGGGYGGLSAGLAAGGAGGGGGFGGGGGGGGSARSSSAANGGAGGVGGFGGGGGGGGGAGYNAPLAGGSGGVGAGFGGSGGAGDTVADASAPGCGGGGGGGAGLGGAIFVLSGSLVVTECDISGNSSTGGAFGYAIHPGTEGQGKGGAIFVMIGAEAELDGQTVLDFSGNAASDAAGIPMDNVNTYGAYTISDAPRVVSIVPTGPSPTGAEEVEFIARFSENVTGVDINDFGLLRTGTTGTISACDAVDGLTYVITVTGVSGDGALRLDLLNNGTIRDLTGIPLADASFAGTELEIDTPPEVLSITVTGTDPDVVYYEVVFDEDVTGVGASDFDVTTTHDAVAAVTDVAQVSGSVYAVTVGLEPVGAPLPGYTVRLDVADNDSVRDVYSNPLGGSGSGNGDFEGDVHVVGAPYPYVVSSAPATSLPTNNVSMDFKVTFSEDINAGTVDSADFLLVKTGTADCDPIGVPSTAGDTVTITITGITGDGTLRLDVVDDGTIFDLVGTEQLGGALAGNGDFSGDDVCIIDNTAPSVVGVWYEGRDLELGRTTAVFTVKFSEDVKGVDTTDFAIDFPGMMGPGQVHAVTPNAVADEFTVTLRWVYGEGPLHLEVLDNGTITDPAGNALTGPYTSSESCNPPPYVVVVHSPVLAGSDLSFTVDFTEPVWGALDISNYFATLTYDVAYTDIVVGGNDGDDTYTVTLLGLTGSGTIRLDVVDDDSIVDAAGDPLAGPGAGNGDFVDGPVYYYNTPPTHVTSVVCDEASPTNRPILTYTVTCSAGVSGLGVADFALAATGTAGGNVAAVPASGAVFTVTIDGVGGDGTLRLDVLAAGITGLGDDFTAGEAYDVDTVPPEVVSVSAVGAPAGGGYAFFEVTFSEDVTGVDATDFAATSLGGPVGTVSSVARVSASVYRVTVSGLAVTGTVRLDVIDDDSIHDLATNPLGGGLLANGEFRDGQPQTYTTAIGLAGGGGCGSSGGGAGAALSLMLGLMAAGLLLRRARRSEA